MHTVSNRASNSASVRICPWKHGYPWVYSITYDEGFVELLEYALPIHHRYGVPGHVAMVAGQLGEVRHVPSSTYDGKYRHLGARQLRDLIAEGWSVGDHSMTHGDLSVDTYVEVVKSKGTLEQAIGRPVTLFHLPGADFSFAPAARYLMEAGFLAVFFGDDRVNSPDPDLLGLSRTLLYVEEGKPKYPLYDAFPRVYDPYHRLHEARESGGWIITCGFRGQVSARAFCGPERLIRTNKRRRMLPGRGQYRPVRAGGDT